VAGFFVTILNFRTYNVMAARCPGEGGLGEIYGDLLATRLPTGNRILSGTRIPSHGEINRIKNIKLPPNQLAHNALFKLPRYCNILIQL
jgi:hypothetical protein